MATFEELQREVGKVNRFHSFQDLMRFRVREVLLVASLYDSFIFEEDGQLYEQILSEYHDLNLSQAPGLTRVSNGRQAIDMAAEQERFDLIIITLNLGDMDAIQFLEEAHERGLSIPVILLTYDDHALSELMSRADLSGFEQIYVWQGDFRLLIAAIKLVEDRRNVDHDTSSVGVQSIILIEDNVHFYSSFLPMIYGELFKHSQNLIAEGINVSDKLLRMRARPKIILCGNYEEAAGYFHKYTDCIMGVITDIEFPRDGKMDTQAGLAFVKEVQQSHFDIPILLQTENPKYLVEAKRLGVSCLLKSSAILLHDLQRFMKNNFSFGDFVFRMPDGTRVDRAKDLKMLEKKLHTIPEECLVYHGERNHFSNWLKARTEFWLAHRLRPKRVQDYKSVDELRTHIINSLRSYRKERYEGSILDFDPQNFDTTSSFARIGGGSLGGKARGLGFAATLINRFKVQNRFEGVHIFVPPTVVLGADVFDRFLDDNDLRDFALQSHDDDEILERFLQARLPEDILRDLTAFLELIRYPLAIRSSSLLEDSRYLPFAGVYQTYMIPNNHEDQNTRLDALWHAIAKVYTSTFSMRTKAYLRSTPYRLEEEKMAVIIQKLVGRAHEERFYPDFAGVVRSHNFYPRPPMTTGDGIASVALGLGKTVVEGGLTVRFCPKYPRHLTQFSGIEDTLNYSQKKFYALRLPERNTKVDYYTQTVLEEYDLEVAEADNVLDLIGSTYSAENNVIYDGMSREGVRLITFAPILKTDVFKLPEILRLVTDVGAWGMNSPVEIEFAVNFPEDKSQPREFAFLQLRPLVKSHEIEELSLDELDSSELFCYSRQVLGNGLISDIHDIVMVDPDKFDRLKTVEVAQEIDQFNSELLAAGRPYILIGMGRWGSADPFLGIPVNWEQISGVRIIIETGFDDIKVTPSQGTHFFQNLTSFRVGYFTVDKTNKDDFLDWGWLQGEVPVSRRKYVKHLRFDLPLVAKMNGHDNRGVLGKPFE